MASGITKRPRPLSAARLPTVLDVYKREKDATHSSAERALLVREMLLDRKVIADRRKAMVELAFNGLKEHQEVLWKLSEEVHTSKSQSSFRPLLTHSGLIRSISPSRVPSPPRHPQPQNFSSSSSSSQPSVSFFSSGIRPATTAGRLQSSSSAPFASSSSSASRPAPPPFVPLVFDMTLRFDVKRLLDQNQAFFRAVELYNMQEAYRILLADQERKKKRDEGGKQKLQFISASSVPLNFTQTAMYRP